MLRTFYQSQVNARLLQKIRGNVMSSFDSKIDDDISVYDDDFEDIEYVEA
nr:hypothetical protein [Tanacetum cinerariifolium]